MKLLQLSCDNPKFRTLNFKEGLNLVIGTQITKDNKKSINGVGKSMSLNMVHYMLGSGFNTISQKKLKNYLEKYGEFELALSHRNEIYTIKKDFKQPHFFINENKITQTDFPKELKRIFLSEDFQFGFRPLFNCFARRYMNDANYYANTLSQQNQSLYDCNQKNINLFLLKMDFELSNRYENVHQKYKELNAIQKSIKNMPKTFNGTNLKDIYDEINKLQDRLNNFIIAPNFDELKQKADDLTEKLNEIRNEIYATKERIKLKQSVCEGSHAIIIDTHKIVNLYEEAKVFFEDKIIQRVEDVQNFHIDLLKNRKKRLNTEIQELQNSLSELQEKEKQIGTDRDGLIKVLDSSGALKEYNSLKDRVQELKLKAQNLEKYDTIIKEFNHKLIDYETEKVKIKQEARDYLENIKNQTDTTEEIFRGFVKRFYEHNGGTLSIIQTKDAKSLFDINVDIPKQDSQGVNEVKTFCYDISLYNLNKNLFGFLAHDGYIFSGMDKRQQSTIFKVALELIQNDGLQYFLNTSFDVLETILDKNNQIGILNDKEKNHIRDSIILELTDEKPSSWLFGEEF